MIHLGKLFVAQGEERAAGDDPFAGRATAGDQFMRGFLLGDHATDEHGIGPGQIGGAQLSDVHIHESFRPFRRQQCGNGQQTQGREGGFFADELERVFETPKRVRELWVEQQGLHRTASITPTARFRHQVFTP
jgi:hypothetical protein